MIGLWPGPDAVAGRLVDRFESVAITRLFVPVFTLLLIAPGLARGLAVILLPALTFAITAVVLTLIAMPVVSSLWRGPDPTAQAQADPSGSPAKLGGRIMRLGGGLLSQRPVGGAVGFGLFGAGLSCVVPQVFTAVGNAGPSRAGRKLPRVAGFSYAGVSSAVLH